LFYNTHTKHQEQQGERRGGRFTKREGKDDDDDEVVSLSIYPFFLSSIVMCVD